MSALVQNVCAAVGYLRSSAVGSSIPPRQRLFPHRFSSRHLHFRLIEQSPHQNRQADNTPLAYNISMHREISNADDPFHSESPLGLLPTHCSSWAGCSAPTSGPLFRLAQKPGRRNLHLAARVLWLPLRALRRRHRLRCVAFTIADGALRNGKSVPTSQLAIACLAAIVPERTGRRGGSRLHWAGRRVPRSITFCPHAKRTRQTRRNCSRNAVGCCAIGVEVRTLHNGRDCRRQGCRETRRACAG